MVPLSKPSIWYKSPKPWVRAAKSNSCKQITSSADGVVGVSEVSVPVKYSSHGNCWEVKSRPVSAETAHSSNFWKKEQLMWKADQIGYMMIYIYIDMLHKLQTVLSSAEPPNQLLICWPLSIQSGHPLFVCSPLIKPHPNKLNKLLYIKHNTWQREVYIRIADAPWLLSNDNICFSAGRRTKVGRSDRKT